MLHCAVCKGSHEGVHFLFAADVVGFVQNVLPLSFGQVGVAVHSGGVGGKGQSEANRYFVEIHNFFSFLRPPLMRGLSAEQADWGRELFFVFSLPPSKLRFATSLIRGRLYAAASNIFSIKMP